MTLKKKPKELKRIDGLLDNWIGWLANNQQNNIQPEINAVLFDIPLPALISGAIFMFACTQCDELFAIKGYCFICKTSEGKFFVRLVDGSVNLGDLNKKQMNIIQAITRTKPNDVDYEKFFLDMFDQESIQKLKFYLVMKQVDYNKING